MAARMGKYAERMETPKKAHKFDDNDLTTNIRFLAQFKIACESSRVSKGTTLKILSMVMKDEPVSCLTVLLTPHKNNEITHKPAEDRQRVDLYMLGRCGFVVEFLCHEFKHFEGSFKYSLSETGFNINLSTVC